MTLVLALLSLQAAGEKDVQAGYDGGFFIGGKDVRLTMEGLLQVNGLFFERDGPHAGEFQLRRMRLEFSGEFHERWLFHIEPKFTQDGVELEEAWVGFQAGDHRFMFGRMKEPFSLEEMASQRHMDMLNFSILNQFVPAEDSGVTYFGSFDLLQVQAGFYNGTGGEDTTSDKDGALRLVLHPWSGLQFGGAGTWGRQKGAIGGEELRTEARVPCAEVVPGTVSDGDRTRLGAEAAFLEGPFAMTAELARVRDELNGETVHFRGGYLQASWVLTGEGKSWKGDPVRTWKGVSPSRPFLKDPELGAWQLVARASRLALDHRVAPFLTNFPERVDSITVGVTWYANDFVKVKANYLRTLYERPIVLAGDAQDNEDVLMMQLQVMF